MKLTINGVEYSFCRILADTVTNKFYFVFADEQTGTDDLVDKMFRYSGSNFLIEKVYNNSLLVRLYLG